MPQDGPSHRFTEPTAAERQEQLLERYHRFTDHLANKAIYGEFTANRTHRKFSPQEIFAEIEEKIEADPEIAAIEKERHELQALIDMVQATDAHEAADLFYREWQRSLSTQDALIKSGERAVPPTKLTRAQAAKLFDGFSARTNLLAYEKLALKHYRRCLELCPDFEVQPGHNVVVLGKDLHVLILDLETRQAERLENTIERDGALREFDERYNALISSFGDDGKRFELQLIYVLRRLIHAVGTGHLCSVTHGTLREDLDTTKQVDIRLSAAGRSYTFQIKVQGDVGADYERKMRQYQTWDKALHYTRNSQTEIVRLGLRDIITAFESARRQANDRLSFTDKLTALDDLLNMIGEEDSRHLLTVLGITEEALLEERRQTRAAEESIRQRQEEIRKVEAAGKARALELELELEREAAENKAAEAKAAADRIEAARKAAEEKKRLEEEQRLAAQARLEEEARRFQEGIVAEAAAREKARIERKAAEAAEKKQAESNEKRAETIANRLSLKGIKWPAVLATLGLFPKDWNGRDPDPLNRGKAEFVRLFVANKATALVTAQMTPSPLFSKLFPNVTDLENIPESIAEKARGVIAQKSTIFGSQKTA